MEFEPEIEGEDEVFQSAPGISDFDALNELEEDPGDNEFISTDEAAVQREQEQKVYDDRLDEILAEIESLDVNDVRDSETKN